MAPFKGTIKLSWPLSLDRTLLCGQSFRFVKNEEKFVGVYARILWRMEATKDELQYEVLGELKPPPKAKRAVHYAGLLRKYFRLDEDLAEQHRQWQQAHAHFSSKKESDDALVTQLDQQPVETVFSFICSQNNNIKRISSLVEKLCTNFGEKICTHGEKDYFAFPSLEALSQETAEGKLRELGFGYRAKYIQKAAQEILANGGDEWLEGLKLKSYEDAHAELLKLSGIGPKVADCICLMCLNFLQAIPVDTHVLKIAQHYVPDLAKNSKSMNMTLYRKIGDAFRNVYGDKSGVAQTVLFCKELNVLDASKEESAESKKKRKS